MPKVLLISILFLLSSCATSIVQYSESRPVGAGDLGEAYSKYSKPSSTTGTVIVVRDTGFLGSAGEADFFVNGQLVAEIDVKESIKLHLEPDEYLFGIGPGASISLAETKKFMEEQALNVISGITYYYRISIVMDKGLILQRTSQVNLTRS